MTPTLLEKALFTEILPNDVPTEWEETRQQVIKTMRMRWADSTRQARNRLYDELMEEATLAPQIALQTTAAIMIEKKKVTIQTKLTYAKNLHTVLRSLNNDVTILAHYIAGLRAMGAEKPINQAKPISKELLLAIECPLPVKVALLLARKTASRVDEIARLKKESFLKLSPEEVIVDFADRTKKSRGKPFLPENLCVVTGDLTSFLCENIPAALEDWPKQSQIQKHLPKPYTMHSIKHGCAIVLIEAAANGLLEPGLVPLVLKHQSKQPLGPVTLRYAAGRLDLAAKVLRTQDATRHL